MTADDGGGTRQGQLHGQCIPAGSIRSAAPHIRFAKATAEMWGDRGWLWATNTSDEYLAIGSIAVTDEVAWSLVPSAGIGELPGNPLRGWMHRGPQPQKPAPVMPQDEQTIQKPERNRRDHEEVHRNHADGIAAMDLFVVPANMSTIGATNRAFNRDHAAAATSRHVCMAEARKMRVLCSVVAPSPALMAMRYPEIARGPRRKIAGHRSQSYLEQSPFS
jgi:hypothetical protein